MKQTVFMIAVTTLGCVGSFTVSPFWGLAVYYLFATLRPQYMWEWSLPRDVSWSFYVAIATIAATVLGVRGPLERNQRIQLNAIHYCCLAFGGWVSLSYVFAHNPEAGNLWMIDYSKHYTMLIIAFFVLRSIRQIWILFHIITLCLGYIAYEINYLYLVNGYLGIVKNGYGGHDNNGAGLYLAMGVPMCIALWEGTKQKYRWLFLAVVPVLIHAVLMTYSRGAMLSMLIAAPLSLFRGKYRARKLLFAGLIALLVPIMAGQEIRNRFASISDNERDDSANSRFTSWAIGLQIAREHPVLGVGVRNSNLFTYAYGADKEGRTIHNQYIQVAADNGFVGTGLYILVLFFTFRSFFTVRSLSPESEEVRAIATGLTGALTTFVVGACFLSLEAFELQYLLFTLAAQLLAVCRAKADPLARDVCQNNAGPADLLETTVSRWGQRDAGVT
jgi:probable O-glycosylation ligase (exosortase A-associated)